MSPNEDARLQALAVQCRECTNSCLSLSAECYRHRGVTSPARPYFERGLSFDSALTSHLHVVKSELYPLRRRIRALRRHPHWGAFLVRTRNTLKYESDSFDQFLAGRDRAVVVAAARAVAASHQERNPFTPAMRLRHAEVLQQVPAEARSWLCGSVGAILDVEVTHAAQSASRGIVEVSAGPNRREFRLDGDRPGDGDQDGPWDITHLQFELQPGAAAGTTLRVYVQSSLQGQGVGIRLYEELLNRYPHVQVWNHSTLLRDGHALHHALAARWPQQFPYPP